MPFDLSYLFHATIDLENFNKLLKSSLSKNTNSSYPYYNILKLNINNYRISFALSWIFKK